MRNVFIWLLAVVLIICCVAIVGMAGLRLLQEIGWLEMGIEPSDAVALDASLAVAQTPLPLLAGVESGGMALRAASAQSALADAAGGAVMDVPVEPTLPSTPLPTVDACTPQPEPGFAAESTVVAIGMIRLYSDTDVLAATLGEFGTGQGFVVTADAAGVTAIRRCELVWVRVRLAGGAQGWVLAHAVEIGLPTAVPTLPATLVAPICPGGCATPSCVQPCINPCAQPCIQPCALPCGVYSQ